MLYSRIQRGQIASHLTSGHSPCAHKNPNTIGRWWRWSPCCWRRQWWRTQAVHLCRRASLVAALLDNNRDKKTILLLPALTIAW